MFLTENVNLLPLNQTSFSILRKEGRIYVDKTDLIGNLAQRTGAFFLTRPRRFGKSLLISTFESLFRSGLKDFHNLKIEKFWNDPNTYPVVRLNFATLPGVFKEGTFYERFYSKVSTALRMSGLLAKEEAPIANDDDFRCFLDQLGERKIVLLIDEYDSPLLNSLTNETKFQEIRDTLQIFFNQIKDYSSLIRFCFITGITRFHKVGFSSALNNVIDITQEPAFGNLLGLTLEELKSNFSFYIKEATSQLGLSENKLLEMLQIQYNGFCFESTGTKKVFSPWSVLNFFGNPQAGFVNYWYQSASLLNLMSNFFSSNIPLTPSNYGKEKIVSLMELNDSFDFHFIREETFLAQTGYLTIKKVEGDSVFLDFPNKEVRDSMAILFSLLLLKGNTLVGIGADEIFSLLRKGSLKEIVSCFNRMFSSLDYVRFPAKDENSVRSYLQVFLLGARLSPSVEVHNSFGRSNLEVKAGGRHWIFEIKVISGKSPKTNKILKKGASQLEKYGTQYSGKILKAVLIFSLTERKIIDWSLLEEGSEKRPDKKLSLENN